MPHLTVELSANVAQHHDVDELVAVVHTAALDHGLAAADALRTRAAVREHVRVGTGDPEFGFVAIHARIGPGRTAEAKRTFLEQVLDAAEDALGGTPLAIMWSIECTEIDAEFRINRNRVRERMRGET